MSDKYLPEKFSIKPINSEHSKTIQERLFRLGYEWSESGQLSRDYGGNRIDVDRSNKMFNACPYSKAELITLDDLYRLERKPEFKTVYGNGWRIEENTITVTGRDLPDMEAIEMAKKILEVYNVN